MKLKYFVPSTLATLVLCLSLPSLAQTDTETIARARANYPLKTCIVSGEPLGNLDEAVAYIHRSAGKPDRVVFLCCDGCIDDFKADPAKYLKKLDDATKSKS